MSFFKKLSRLFVSPYREEQGIIWVYVQCDKCGEKMRTRVNTRTELTPEFGNSDIASSYFSRKVLIGDKHCFQPIELIMKFDAKHHLVDKQISGGKFITKDEFEIE